MVSTSTLVKVKPELISQPVPFGLTSEGSFYLKLEYPPSQEAIDRLKALAGVAQVIVSSQTVMVVVEGTFSLPIVERRAKEIVGLSKVTTRAGIG